VKSQFLKERSSRVHNKALDMQRALQESLDASKMAISSLQLPSQEVMKEIDFPQEGEQLDQEELSKIHNNILSQNSMISFEINKTSQGLKISIGDNKLKQAELNTDDFKEIETVEIHLKRYSRSMEETNSSDLRHIFSKLEKLTSLEVCFDPEGFEKRSLRWLESIIYEKIQNLTSLCFDLDKCAIQWQRFRILCDLVFSKTRNLQRFFLHLNSSGVTKNDLTALIDSLNPFHRNLECFTLGLANNRVTDDEIEKVFEMIQSMKALKDLQLILSRTSITNKSLKKFGESVLPHLQALDSFELCVKKTSVSNKGILPILRNLPNLKRLELYLSDTRITNKAVNVFLEDVLPRLKSLESLTFAANKTQISNKNFEKIRDVSESLKKKKQVMVDEILDSE